MDTDLGASLYLRLSAMMFLEFAIWGAWAPVLAARLLGPLKMSGKQTGWIYATLPLACIISPLVAGQLADQYINTEWILAACHLIGGVLLLIAAKRKTFVSLFVVMLFYSTFYAATLPLVNSLMFTHLKDIDSQSANIFIWAPIAWALIGYSLTGFRMMRKGEGDGSDCLVLAGILSFVMAAVCLMQNVTPPEAPVGEMPIVVAFSKLSDTSFLIFMIISMVVAGTMQFYFLGTAQFMQDIGISSKKLPACMAVAQATQAIATLFVLGGCLALLGFKWTLLGTIGFKGTFLIGAGAWLLMYIFYVAIQKPAVIVISQGLHGVAYVAFIILGQVYANTIGPDIKASMQALIMAATTGLGLFLGTQLAGIVMDKFSVDGKFVWQKIWMVPGGIVLAGMIAMAILFNNPPPKDDDAPKEPTVIDTPESACIAPIDYVARLG